MSEQIREQVSAFLDGELPNSETELLLKRLTRDGELRESFGRYALIGEALRGSGSDIVTKGFASRVNLAIDGEAVQAATHAQQAGAPRWWRPLAGVAVAAGVAAVAIVALQQRAITPTSRPALAVTAQNIAAAPAHKPGAGGALLYGAGSFCRRSRGAGARPIDELYIRAQQVLLGFGPARRAGGFADRG